MPTEVAEVPRGHRIKVVRRWPWYVRWPLALLRFVVRGAGRLTGRGIAGGARLGWKGVRAATGRHRWAVAPLWVALASCWVTTWSWAAWWAAAALAGVNLATWQDRAASAAAKGRPEPRRFLSRRETGLVAGTFGAVGFWHLAGSAGLTGGLPAWVPAVVLVGPAAVPWWRWRRVLPRRVPAVIEAWHATITDGEPGIVGSLRGTTFTDWDGVRETPDGVEGDATLAVPLGTVPSAVTSKDELAQHLLGAPAGTIQIGRHPSGSTQHVRVRFTPTRNSDVVWYWQEPTYDPATGLFLAGYSHASAPGHAGLNSDGSASHGAIVGGSGAGKSSPARLVAVEAALSPLWCLIVLDGKRGTGIPSVRDGAAFYARTPEQWRDAMFAMEQMRLARLDLYGDAGRDRFRPALGDPGFLTLRDEWPTIHQAWPALVRKAHDQTREGRSLGFAEWFMMQKGDAYGWGDVGVRANVYANGWLFAGTAGDAAAAGVAGQTFGIDFTQIPGRPGWMAVVSMTADDRSGQILRVQYLPSTSDVEDGKPAPFGTCQDVMHTARRDGLIVPAMHPRLREILDRLVEGDPDLSADAADYAADAEREAKTVALDRMLAHLAALEGDDADAGVHRGDLATVAGVSPGHASRVLAAALKDGLVEQEAEFRPYKITDLGRARALETAV